MSERITEAAMADLGVLGRNALLAAAHELGDRFDPENGLQDAALAGAEAAFIEAVLSTLHDFDLLVDREKRPASRTCRGCLVDGRVHNCGYTDGGQR